MEILSAFLIGLVPAFLLLAILAALPSLLLLGFVGVAVIKQFKRPVNAPAGAPIGAPEA